MLRCRTLSDSKLLVLTLFYYTYVALDSPEKGCPGLDVVAHI
jgi:hypothetical protein